MTLKDFAKRLSKTIIPEPLYSSTFRPVVRAVLLLIFGRKGCRVNIGGQAVFRMSPEFAFRGWESFGDRHNSGFSRCIQVCSGKSVFIDVGAHIGLYSLPVSEVLKPGGRVYAFEPAESNYHHLLKHIAYNNIDNILAYQTVVGDTTKDSVVFYEHVVSSSPFSGLVRKKTAASYVGKQRSQVCLDDFCAENGLVPDVIKIDVEGAELLVLRGVQRILTQYEPMIFLSIHPSHLEMLGQSTSELMKLLCELGYEVRATDGIRVDELGSGEHICVKRDGWGTNDTFQSLI